MAPTKLTISNNVLYQKFECNGGLPPYCQMILPTAIRTPFLELIHADTGGHLKFDKCVPLVQQQAWWFTWRRDLRRFILRCKACQAHIDGKSHHQVLLKPLLQEQPRELRSVELTGPFPWLVLTVKNIYLLQLLVSLVCCHSADCQ